MLKHDTHLKQLFFKIHTKSKFYQQLTLPGRFIHDTVFPIYLNLFREGGTEHHSSSLASRWHSVLLYNTTDLRLKTHVQHSVSLIQDQESVNTRQASCKFTRHTCMFTRHMFKESKQKGF